MSELGDQRHHSRERALEILYEAEMKDRSALVVLNELPVRPDEYTIALLTATMESQKEAEDLISRFAVDWALDRIALVDRLVMTMAIAEMMMPEPPPTAVILDEAVEIAKIFSTDGSGSFVNGVLSAVAGELTNK